MKTKTSTTVWTNHGEPQEIDEKYAVRDDFVKELEDYGVALQAEVETDATRQAKATHPGWRNSRVRSFVSDLRAKNNELQLELIQARLERGKFRKERDELLAALKGVFKVVESRVSNAELNNWQELLAAGRDAIDNASK